MNGVSQKAHFMIESAVTTASLQAQLKAKIAPGVGPVPGPLAPTALPLPGAIVLPEPEVDLDAPLPLGPRVSVLSQSFCRAASG